jgi:D-alanyl-D-alanine carboxypeptidase
LKFMQITRLDEMHTSKIRQNDGEKKRLSIRSLVVCALSLALLLTLSPTDSFARYASVVIDSRTGQVLSSRNADQRLYPASLTKIMTLYMTFDALSRGKLKMQQKLKVSARAAGQAPTKLGLKKGGRITVKDAMFGLITKSANDAATVLAEAMAPTEAAFARKMTAQAKKLGMSRTSFRNASGLPNRRQKSTAHDMALLGAAMIHDFPQFYRYMSLQSFNYKGKSYKNHNNLLGRYAGADGIKTGYIRASGFNLVASAKRGDNRLIGVVFGGRTAKSRDRHMQKLLDKGFNRVETVRPFSIPLPSVRPVNVALGKSHGGQLRKPIVVASAQPAPIIKPVPKAILTAPGVKNWGIQVGAFSRASKARDQLNMAMSRTDGLMNGARYNIRKVTRKGQPIYRAQMLGFSEKQAYTVCKNLKRQAVNCFVVTPNTGNLLRVALN